MPRDIALRRKLLGAALRRRLRAANPIAHLAEQRRLHADRRRIAELETALDASLSLHSVPLGLCHALRAPTGTLQTLRLHLSDGTARVAIHPIGEPDAAREVAIWHEINTVTGQPGTGERLQPLDPAIVLVAAGAAVVINARQTRRAVRVALAALRHQHAALLPAPLVWVAARARRHAKTAGTGMAALAVVAMATTAAALWSRPEPPGSGTRASPTISLVSSAPPSHPSATSPDASATPPGHHPTGRTSPHPARPTTRPARHTPALRPETSPAAHTPRPPRRSPRPAPHNSGDGPSPAPEAASTARPPVRHTGPPASRPSPGSSSRPSPGTPPRPSSSPAAPSREPATEPATGPSGAAGSGPDCHLVDVDVDLPPLGVDLCL